MPEKTPTANIAAVLAAFSTGETVTVAYVAKDGKATERTGTVSEVKSNGVIFSTEKGLRLMLWEGIQSV